MTNLNVESLESRQMDIRQEEIGNMGKLDQREADDALLARYNLLSDIFGVELANNDLAKNDLAKNDGRSG